MPVDMPVASIPVHNKCAVKVLEAGTDGAFYVKQVTPTAELLAKDFTPETYHPLKAADAWLCVARAHWPTLTLGINKVIARYLENKYRGLVFFHMTGVEVGYSYVADNDLIATQEF